MSYIREEHEIDGNTYRVKAEYDEYAELPWESDCIYEGVVSDWQYRDKHPHERILCTDRTAKRFFDVRQFIKVAKSHGCTGAQAQEQLEPCFDRLQRFCNDQWSYVTVCVELLNEDGNVVREYSDYLGGVESDCIDYINETSLEMAQGLAARLGAEKDKRYRAACCDIVTV